MKTFDIYQVDAFSSILFSGNPAAVVMVEKFPDDLIMQQIASENNLSETAFIETVEEAKFNLRWFTPNGEVDLCGHATLAAAFVINFLNPTSNHYSFDTKSGRLKVTKQNEKFILDFPSDKGTSSSETIYNLIQSEHIIDVLRGNDDLMIVTTEDEVINFVPDESIIKRLEGRGLIITSRSKKYDFISRCFYPKYNILEDPVTGSAHTLLTPYWALRLGKNKLRAKQASSRGGIIDCVYRGQRVSLIGEGCLYLKGQIYY